MYRVLREKLDTLYVALAAVQTEEQRRELLAHLQQLVPSAAGSPSAVANT